MKPVIQSFFIILCFIACKNSTLKNECSKLELLDSIKATPSQGDWLESRNEKYLTLEDYISRKPLRTDKTRKFLYMVKLGNFDPVSDKIFAITQEYLEAFFLIETKELGVLSVQTIPATNKRENGQIDAAYTLDSILYPLVPKDAHSIIALTPIDLYPGNDWNYVFGLASYQKRVGVWSISRFMENNHDSTYFEKALFRTLHVASHETGHMFGLSHCAVYECNMNGSNSLTELDKQVSWLCHECLTKLCWNRETGAEKHIKSMNSFYLKYLPASDEAVYYKHAAEIMDK